jgi:hypothetical protein
MPVQKQVINVPTVQHTMNRSYFLPKKQKIVNASFNTQIIFKNYAEKSDELLSLKTNTF